MLLTSLDESWAIRSRFERFLKCATEFEIREFRCSGQIALCWTDREWVRDQNACFCEMRCGFEFTPLLSTDSVRTFAARLRILPLARSIAAPREKATNARSVILRHVRRPESGPVRAPLNRLALLTLTPCSLRRCSTRKIRITGERAFPRRCPSALGLAPWAIHGVARGAGRGAGFESTRGLTNSIPVVAADQLARRDLFRMPQPFAVVTVDGEQTMTTSAIKVRSPSPRPRSIQLIIPPPSRV